jgi:hypothetical protein
LKNCDIELVKDVRVKWGDSMDVHLFVHYCPDDSKLDRILTLLTAITAQEKTTKMTLEELSAQVKANTDTEASAITLIDGIAAQLASAKNDPAKIQALADSLKTSAASLSADIVANTPSA